MSKQNVKKTKEKEPNLTTQGGRLLYFMQLEGFKSQQKLADCIDVSRSSVNKVITSSSNFEVKNYIKLYESYTLSPNWLILGIGPMYLDGKNLATAITTSGQISSVFIEETRKIVREELNQLRKELQQ